MTESNPAESEYLDLVTRLRNEISSEMDAQDETTDWPAEVPSALARLLATDGIASLEVGAALDAVLADSEPLPDALYERLVEATRSAFAARPKSMIIEQLLAEERARQGRLLDDFADSADELRHLEQIENGRKPIDSIEAERMAAWILWLNINSATAIPAVDRSLIATGSGYAGSRAQGGSSAQKFVERVRSALLQQQERANQESDIKPTE